MQPSFHILCTISYHGGFKGGTTIYYWPFLNCFILWSCEMCGEFMILKFALLWHLQYTFKPYIVILCLCSLPCRKMGRGLRQRLPLPERGPVRPDDRRVQLYCRMAWYEHIDGFLWKAAWQTGFLFQAHSATSNAPTGPTGRTARKSAVVRTRAVATTSQGPAPAPLAGREHCEYHL